VNFFTGKRPGMPFQTSMSRLADHSATRLASSCWLLKLSPSPASCLLVCAVMVFSVSIVYVVNLLFPYAAVAVMTFITLPCGTSKSILWGFKKRI